MSEQRTTPPAGWYQDPELPGQQRWWNGERWAPSQPRPPMLPVLQAPPQRTRASGFGVASLLIGMIAVLAVLAPIPPLGVGASIVGLVLGVVGVAEAKRRPHVALGASVVGIVLNSIAIAIILLTLLLYVSGR